MDRIRIRGGRPLVGAIEISGAKNAALPIMAASLLTDQPLRLSNLPHLADITTLANLLVRHGAAITMNGQARAGGHAGRALTLEARTITNTTAPYDLVRKMRASILVLGPILARCGHARVSLPGGCAIGTRPIDLHITALERLGARIALEGGYIEARAPTGLHGARIRFPHVSVGATENALMAATLARGETVIENAAREPEVGDLARCLLAMGAVIDGIDTECLRVQGTERLGGAEHAVLPDRIETGTYAMAAAATGGEIELRGARRDDNDALTALLAEAGVTVTATNSGITAARTDNGLAPVAVATAPYPGVPTDLQAQLMALMTRAHGTSTITETIFENRFMHVPELLRMGADIRLDGSTATIRGVAALKGAPVMATDLRASVSMVLAGLVAEGETVVNRVYHLDRGYERLEEKLSACGADIERVRD